VRGLERIAFDAPKSLAEITEERLRQLIVNGELEFGEQVTESRLSDLFGLSKTPVREALLRLSIAGLVEIKARSGTYVFSLTDKNICDISTLRITLEQAAIRSAMRENAARLMEELNRNLDAARALHATFELATYRALDHEFHQILVRHSDNPYLIDCYSTISTKVLAMRNRLTFSREYINKSIDEHRAVTRALVENDVDGACIILAEHVNCGFTERTRRLLTDIARMQ